MFRRRRVPSPRGPRTIRRALPLAAGCLIAVTACSNHESSVARQPQTGSASASEVNGVQQVTVTVGDAFRFNPSTITVHQGRVKITLVHKGSGAPHDWQLPQFPSDQVPLVNAGQSTSATFTTPSPGRYQFVCTLHVAQGMTGTLVVLPD